MHHVLKGFIESDAQLSRGQSADQYPLSLVVQWHTITHCPSLDGITRELGLPWLTECSRFAHIYGSIALILKTLIDMVFTGEDSRLFHSPMILKLRSWLRCWQATCTAFRPNCCLVKHVNGWFWQGRPKYWLYIKQSSHGQSKNSTIVTQPSIHPSRHCLLLLLINH